MPWITGRLLPRVVLIVAALTAGSHGSSPTTLVGQSPPRRFTAEDALDLVRYEVLDLSQDGEWLAASSSTERDGLGVDFGRDGDPSYIRPSQRRLWAINTRTGKAQELFPQKRNVRTVAWSPSGRHLAIVVLEGGHFVVQLWERATGRITTPPLPAGTALAENTELHWSRDGGRLLFALRGPHWNEEVGRRFRALTEGPVLVQSSKEPFLAWDDLGRWDALRSIVSYTVATGAVREVLADTRVGTWNLAEDDSTLVYTEDVSRGTNYDVIFGRDYRLVARSGAGDRVLVARFTPDPTEGPALLWSRSGLRYVLTQDRRLWTGTIQDSSKRLVAGPLPDAKPPVDTTKAARDAQANERFTPLRVSDDGRELIASNPQGLWFLDLQDGHREMFLASPDSATVPRYTVDGWSEDRQTIYLRVNARTEWRRGLARYHRGQRRLVSVANDARVYGPLHFSRNGATAVLTISDRADLWGPSIAPLFVATDSLTTVRSLLDPNPAWPARALGNAELLPYFDADGRREYGVVYYPPDYTPGKPYPTVFWLYEQFFDPAYLAPIQVLVSSGYVVVTPSVHLETGYPSEAWLKGVTGAANALIERGIADSTRLGVYGISYGGYATNLLVTQTNRFKAAINISGKVDMVSFYTDSPRLGVRNTHAPEKSQDRLGATLWQQPQKYLQHSAILNADRISTPLLLITGDKDANVPARNTAGMFYALRRLGKQVEWVDYLNGGHAWPLSTADDFIDFHRRIVEWFDRYLKR